jgi:hypothetical protein
VGMMGIASENLSNVSGNWCGHWPIKNGDEIRLVVSVTKF